MERKNIVGIRVRKARKNAKPPITQVELIARLQVLGVIIEQPALSKIERGYRPVIDSEVVALSQALKVSAAWLLGMEK
jgi:HTH-type transcriptional regulator, cell division transcriptional repressor